MHPYRDPPRCEPAASPPADERASYALLVAIGAVRVAIAWLGEDAFRGEATLGGLLLAVGVFGLLRAR